MRQARLKVPADRAVGYYHCMSRVVDRVHRFGEVEKEQFTRILREYESFCEVRVLTFCLMGNHFHLLVEVPRRPLTPPSPEALLAKLEALSCQQDYGWVRQRLELLRQAPDPAALQAFLESFYRRMWDLSWFLRLVKQRFSLWYNRRTGRKGTLWEERFKSVLVEGAGATLLTMAAYIDLNPVRANLVEDPKNYRWSGYGQAIAGNTRAHQGLQTLVTALTGQPKNPLQTLETYRMHLYQQGHEERETRLPDGTTARGALSHQALLAVLANKGRLPTADYLRCHVRYFCDGAILGSKDFVNSLFLAYRHQFGPHRPHGANRLRGLQDKLYSLRNLQHRLFG